MNEGTDPILAIHSSHSMVTPGTFWPLFLLCIPDYLVKHGILEYFVHEMAPIGYLLVNPCLHIDVN